MTNLISISDARANLPDLVSEVYQTMSRAMITVNGQPKVVVMSLDELESLEETAIVGSIPGVSKTLNKAKDQIKKGQFITLEELQKKYPAD